MRSTPIELSVHKMSKSVLDVSFQPSCRAARRTVSGGGWCVCAGIEHDGDDPTYMLHNGTAPHCSALYSDRDSHAPLFQGLNMNHLHQYDLQHVNTGLMLMVLTAPH